MYTRVHNEMLCTPEYKAHFIVGVVETFFIYSGYFRLCKNFVRKFINLTPFRLGYFVIPFLLYLLSNYHQTWHASTMAQNLSKAVTVKSIMTSL